MAGVWYWFRISLRSRWRAWAGVGLLAGIAMGAVVVAAAGARRTDSSLHRIVVEERSSDLLIAPNNGTFTAAQISAIRGLPQVAQSGYARGAIMTRLQADGTPDFEFAFAPPGLITIGDPDGRLFTSVDRPHVVAGRMPTPTAADEILVSRSLAAARHLGVGDTIPFGFFDSEQVDAAASPEDLPAPRVYRLRVTGIAERLDDVARSDDDPRLSGSIFMSPALTRAVADLAPPYEELVIRLRDPRELKAFEQQASRIVSGDNGVAVAIQETGSTVQRARRATRPFVLALWLFALLAALAGGGVVAQTALRQQRSERGDGPTLRALGASRGDLVAFGLLRGVFIGAVAGVTAAGVAIAASPLMPLGPLRRLEPHQGVDVDFAVLAIGVAFVAGAMVVHAVLASGHRVRSPRPSHVVGDALARNGMPAPVVAGVRFAFDRGRGDSAIPLRSTLFGVVLAVTAVVAMLVYGSGLTHFTSTPSLYGWVWSYQIEPESGIVGPLLAAVKDDPDVRASALGYYAQPSVGGKHVTAVAIAREADVPLAAIVDGRAAQDPDEIVVGAETLRGIGRRVGDRVDVTIGARTLPLTVVGTAVFARFAPYPASNPTGLGIGAALTTDALARFGPLDPDADESPYAGPPFVLVQTKSGTTADAVFHNVLHDDPTAGIVLGAQRPNDLVSYQHLRRTPLVLIGILVLLAIATTAHLLVTGVRRRRRDLGLLRAIGFTGSQLRASVLVQASTLVGIALVIAVPLGVFAGRSLWSLTAHWLGIPVENVVPGATIAAVVVGALLVANAAALLPAIAAGRVRPAVALRTE